MSLAFHRNLFLALMLTLVAPSAASQALAKPTLDEAGARVITISTHGASTHQRLVLSLDKAAVVQLDVDARDVLVSNPDLVDAVVRTPRRIFLLATKVGQTNAFFFDGQGKQILSLDIRVEKDVVDLTSLIKSALPNSSIQVQSINDTVVLTGSVSSTLESTRATTLAAGFTGDPKKVINMLNITGGQQVMLKVRVAEMDRNIAKQFGVNVEGAKVVNGTPLTVSSTPQFSLVGQALNNLMGGGAGLVCPAVNAAGQKSTVQNPFQVWQSGGSCAIGNNIQGTLQALERVGLVHLLAEPNLTAVSGETARFLAGGEFPVPVAKDLQGNVTVEFKQFGVGLSFTPVVLSSGMISLQLSSEVSELTNAGSFLLQGGAGGGGLNIPALSVRRTQTTVELPSGGSFAVAGLMQHNTKQVIDGFPGVKDLPVLGALFRSRDFADDQTELVVLVSAYLVEPTTEAALAAPTDGFVAPADPETLLLGRLNAVYKKPDGKPMTSNASAPVGFVVR